MIRKRNSLLGRTADITIDRQSGCRNIRHKNITYSVRTGCFAAEKNLAVKKHIIYIIGAENTSDTFRGTIISTIRRKDTGQLLLVAAPEGKFFYEPQIRECIGFYERQHQSDFEFYMTIDCGIILYKDYGDRIRFLLAKDRATGKTGFIKGALEFGETEKEAAVREITHSTGINVNITDDFRTEYIQGNSENKKKKIVMFLAQYSEKVIKIPEECSFRTVNLEFAEAMKQLDNPQERILLMEARDYYENKRKSSENMRRTEKEVSLC